MTLDDLIISFAIAAIILFIAITGSAMVIIILSIIYKHFKNLKK